MICISGMPPTQDAPPCDLLPRALPPMGLTKTGRSLSPGPKKGLVFRDLTPISEANPTLSFLTFAIVAASVLTPSCSLHHAHSIAS